MPNVGIIIFIFASAALALLVVILAIQHRARFRRRLRRTFELRDLVAGSASPKAFFQNFEPSLKENPLKLRRFLELEAQLQVLDPLAWAFLKSEVAPLLVAKHDARGWQQLFDKLNQARAYGHLKRQGCINIKFIPESKNGGKKTPDLEALLGATQVLCEVKTINTSEAELARRGSGGVMTMTNTLDVLFLQKLTSTLTSAHAQLTAVDRPALQLIYVIVNFDEFFHEYAEEYRADIEAYLIANPLPDGFQVYFDIKPPFG